MQGRDQRANKLTAQPHFNAFSDSSNRNCTWPISTTMLPYNLFTEQPMLRPLLKKNEKFPV